MHPYTIWTPGYTHMSGGIRALYTLGQEIFNRGYLTGFHQQFRHPKEIVVYPEIVNGNPLGAERYVKWLLNKADFPNEICYAWESGMGNYPLLTVNIIEMDLWKPSTEKTNSVAYWVGKGSVNHSVIPDGAIEIGKHNFPDRAGLAKFISELDYLISFDPFTAINLEAVVSGTPVLIHTPESQWKPSIGQQQSGGWNRQEVEGHGWIKYGVAWSIDELEEARKTVQLARDHYLSLINIFSQRIDNFIQTTQEIFN